MAKSRMTLAEIMAVAPDVDLARIDATTEQDIGRHMREEGYDPDETVRDEDIISPAIIRKRLGLSQRCFAEAFHVAAATLLELGAGTDPHGPQRLGIDDHSRS
jgi:putative transcriptional regulator